MRALKVGIATAILTGAISVASAQQPDNTKMNDGAAHSQTTADKAKNDKTDLSLEKQIRRSVFKDKSLSTYAHNVKIVAKDGKVTLSGPVKSDEDKKTIEQKATEVAGAGNVTNDITVKGAS